MEKKEYVSKLAKFLVDNNSTMSADILVTHLNWNKFRTDAGTVYRAGRGIYKLIESTYKWLQSSVQNTDAENVAKAFKKPDGTFAYD